MNFVVSLSYSPDSIYPIRGIAGILHSSMDVLLAGSIRTCVPVAPRTTIVFDMVNQNHNRDSIVSFGPPRSTFSDTDIPMLSKYCTVIVLHSTVSL